MNLQNATTVEDLTRKGKRIDTPGEYRTHLLVLADAYQDEGQSGRAEFLRTRAEAWLIFPAVNCALLARKLLRAKWPKAKFTVRTAGMGGCFKFLRVTCPRDLALEAVRDTLRPCTPDAYSGMATHDGLDYQPGIEHVLVSH